MLFYWAIYLRVPALFLAYCICVPFLFGAISIGICSGKMEFWTYNLPDRLKIKNSSFHLMGLWYASTLNFVLILLGEALFNKTNIVSTLKFGLTFAVIYCLLGTLLDLLNVETNLLIVRNRAARTNLGTLRTVFSYGPYYFGSLGFLFGIVTKIGYFTLVEKGMSVYLYPSIFIGFIILSLPYLSYFGFVYYRILKYRRNKEPV